MFYFVQGFPVESYSKTCQCVILCPGMSRSISSSSSKTYSIATSSLCTCRTIMANEKLCLKWNDFQHLVQISFGELRISNDFSDVTLVCEGQSLQAHKVILSARSPFFKAGHNLGNNSLWSLWEEWSSSTWLQFWISCTRTLCLYPRYYGFKKFTELKVLLFTSITIKTN